MLLDPATGKTKVLTSMHDDAWIDGPGRPRWAGYRTTRMCISNQSAMDLLTFTPWRSMAVIQCN